MAVVNIRRDDELFFAALVVLVVVLFVGVVISLAWHNEFANKREAQLCRMNGGQPVTNYYGELACVQVNTIKHDEGR